MKMPDIRHDQGVLRRLVRARGLGLLLRLTDRLGCGSLDLVLPDGTTRRMQGAAPGPHAVLVVHRSRLIHRYLRGGRLGFAESYIAGDWDTPDLATLLALLSLNVDAWGNEQPSTPLHRWQRRLRHLLRPNSRAGSRRNIHAHYDLGNAFFAAWLDPSLTYSSALFGPEATGLEQAQHAKNRSMAQRLGLAPGHRLLEIGCGWGGFAITVAKELGAQVKAITDSRAQDEPARARVFREGLAERIEILIEDYRDVRGRFDRIASIEMFEAVGERFWPAFFGQLRERLASDGRAGLQVITIADRYYEAYRRDADFIQAYIFPGGMLPSPAQLAARAKAAGLATVSELGFGLSYAETLRLWNERFQAAWPQVRELGFDERFRRIWTYYLAYCEAGFRTCSTDVVQTVLRPA